MFSTIICSFFFLLHIIVSFCFFGVVLLLLACSSCFFFLFPSFFVVLLLRLLLLLPSSVSSCFLLLASSYFLLFLLSAARTEASLQEAECLSTSVQGFKLRVVDMNQEIRTTREQCRRQSPDLFVIHQFIGRASLRRKYANSMRYRQHAIRSGFS